jgi:hypothetical protein
MFGVILSYDYKEKEVPPNWLFTIRLIQPHLVRQHIPSAIDTDRKVAE